MDEKALEYLGHFYHSQAILLNQIRRVEKYLKRQELLDKKGEALLRKIIQESDKDLWKNYMTLTKAYKERLKISMREKRR